MLEKRVALDLKFKRNYDKSVCEKLKSYVVSNNLNVVHAYLPIKKEIDITSFLKWTLDNKVKVVCPKVMPKRQLQNLELLSFDKFDVGPFKTIHPAGNKVYEGSIDLVVVPGLAFDKNMNRLGYGGGYYDRFLVKYPKAFKYAVQYPFQIVDAVPVEPFDQKVDRLIALEIN
jgi:5-formyltetrahydrofolate cyclo-ligase